jgi:hypothetical protein
VHSNGSLRRRQDIWEAKTSAAPNRSPSVESSYWLSQQAADFSGEIVHGKELADHVHARRQEIRQVLVSFLSRVHTASSQHIATPAIGRRMSALFGDNRHVEFFSDGDVSVAAPINWIHQVRLAFSWNVANADLERQEADRISEPLPKSVCPANFIPISVLKRKPLSICRRVRPFNN